MNRKLSFLVPSPAMAIALVALLAASGGWALAASSKSSVIRACASRKTGALRLAHGKCRHSERSVSWNQTGPAGARGPQGLVGATGATGNTGNTGPQGPGAKTFTASVAEGAEETFATASGVDVKGSCTAGAVFVELEAAAKKPMIDTSGTANGSGTTVAADANHVLGISVSGASVADFDVIARDFTFPSLARIDVHGQHGSPCTFWGMIVPSS